MLLEGFRRRNRIGLGRLGARTRSCGRALELSSKNYSAES